MRRKESVCRTGRLDLPRFVHSFRSLFSFFRLSNPGAQGSISSCLPPASPRPAHHQKHIHTCLKPTNFGPCFHVSSSVLLLRVFACSPTPHTHTSTNFPFSFPFCVLLLLPPSFLRAAAASSKAATTWSMSPACLCVGLSIVLCINHKISQSAQPYPASGPPPICT